MPHLLLVVINAYFNFYNIISQVFYSKYSIYSSYIFYLFFAVMKREAGEGPQGGGSQKRFRGGDGNEIRLLIPSKVNITI